MSAPVRLSGKSLTVISASALILAAPLVKKAEGLVNDPYWDLAHIRTVCRGETHNIEERHYSTAECDAMFEKSLKRHGNQIAHCLPAETPRSLQAGFTSTTYTIGAPKFCASSMAKRAWKGDWAGACQAIKLYVYVGPRDCRLKANRCGGIVVRRGDEFDTCMIDLEA